MLYELCGERWVYLLERVMHPSQEYGLHGTGSNPALLTVPQETLTGAGHEVVEMELGDFLKGTIRIRNAFALRDLSGYYLEWSILRNGEKTEEERRQLDRSEERSEGIVCVVRVEREGGR